MSDTEQPGYPPTPPRQWRPQLELENIAVALDRLDDRTAVFDDVGDQPPGSCTTAGVTMPRDEWITRGRPTVLVVSIVIPAIAQPVPPEPNVAYPQP